ncbi:hypothetical protein CsSME_00040464 [Camellia sinensis var. sinensis]
MIVKVFTLLLFLSFAILLHGATANTKHYIVYMGLHSHPNSESVITANHDILTSVIGRHVMFLNSFKLSAFDISDFYIEY